MLEVYRNLEVNKNVKQFLCRDGGELFQTRVKQEWQYGQLYIEATLSKV